MAQKDKVVCPPENVLWALNACLQEKVMCWKQSVSTKGTRLQNACDVLLAILNNALLQRRLANGNP